MKSPIALAVFIGCAASMVSLPARAVVALPTTSVFEFFGVCDDCTLDNVNGLVAKLTLQDYTPGDAITLGNLVSFEYMGSNIVNPYTVTPDAENPFYIYNLSGSMTPGTSNNSFLIAYEDGLKFESSPNSLTGLADWYTCGRGANGYYSGTCNIIVNQDFGTGGWFAAVPEPSSAGLMALGMLGLGVAVAQRKKAA